MGIRGLNSVIKRYAPEAIINNNIKHYSGKKMAIDCSILLYKYRYCAGNSETSHIMGFLNRVKFYLQNNITPVFIFDGIPPDAKKNVLFKRQANKKKIFDKIDTLKQITPKDDNDKKDINNEIKRLSSQIICIKKSHVEECKEVLRLLGVPYLTAPDEAEKYCAFLQRNGLVDYTVSDDTDCLTFECEKVLKSSIQGDLVEVNLKTVLEKLKMNMDNFVDFCIISGCDYCPYIPHVGPLISYNLILKHKNIETVIEKCKYSMPDNFDYKTARNLFVDFSIYDLPDSFSRSDILSDELNTFLLNFNFKEIYISKYLKTINSF
jgi:flap endonuclease-1